MSYKRLEKWTIAAPVSNPGISLSGCFSYSTALQLLLLAERQSDGLGAIFTLCGSLQHTGKSLCACLRAAIENNSQKLQALVFSSLYKQRSLKRLLVLLRPDKGYVAMNMSRDTFWFFIFLCSQRPSAELLLSDPVTLLTRNLSRQLSVPTEEDPVVSLPPPIHRHSSWSHGVVM